MCVFLLPVACCLLLVVMCLGPVCSMCKYFRRRPSPLLPVPPVLPCFVFRALCRELSSRPLSLCFVNLSPSLHGTSYPVNAWPYVSLFFSCISVSRCPHVSTSFPSLLLSLYLHTMRVFTEKVMTGGCHPARGNLKLRPLPATLHSTSCFVIIARGSLHLISTEKFVDT